MIQIFNASRTKKVAATVSFLLFFGCAKKYDYKDFVSGEECADAVFLNDIHEFIIKSTCANLEYPTAKLRNDDVQISRQLMLLCIRHRLSKQDDFGYNWILRDDVISCAKKHGDSSGNQFATALLKEIPRGRGE